MKVIAAKGVWLWVTDIAAVHVDGLIRGDRSEDAEALVTEIATWLQGRTAAGVDAALVTCRGIVAEGAGDVAGAATLFGMAAEAWAALPRPYDELLALERRGHLMLDAADPSAGLALLSRVQGRLQRLGARWDADRVARHLRQQGVEVARTWRRGPRGYGDVLSPRELETVALVVQGLTNWQIAEQLFLSARTVDRHVSAAMRKLGVSSRTALAIAAVDAGIGQGPSSG